jgi:hypothetical protein
MGLPVFDPAGANADGARVRIGSSYAQVNRNAIFVAT